MTKSISTAQEWTERPKFPGASPARPEEGSCVPEKIAPAVKGQALRIGVSL